MPSTPDAQLLVVDLDHLQAGELCVALGATMLPLLLQVWRLVESGSESHSFGFRSRLLVQIDNAE
jgi:hypothetical protein